MRAYVVRVQEPRAGDETRQQLRGVIDDVATGQHRTFGSGPELLDVLTASAEPVVPTPDVSG